MIKSLASKSKKIDLLARDITYGNEKEGKN